MNDMTATIVAKSDQINAADLIGNPRTITIREVHIKAGDDQPVSILIEGDKKAFRPCKGVRRLLVSVWGADANKYIGQSLTIFHDPTVTWAGKQEGGIRVSHMTGLDADHIEWMRTSRAATKPYKVHPLKLDAPQQQRQRQTAEQWAAEHIAAVQEAADADGLAGIMAKGSRPMGKLETDKPELWAEVNAAYSARRAQIEAPGKPETENGEGFNNDETADWSE